MPNIINITSSQNKYIKQTICLKTKKEREKTKLFIAEGERLTSEISNNWEIEYIVLSKSYLNTLTESHFEKELFKRKIFSISDELFLKVSDTINPQGILAVCRQKKYNQENIENILNKENPFFILLEKIQDPGNLGTLIRTADAANVDAIFLSKGCVDLYNSKTIRASMGSIFHLPIIVNSDFDILFNSLKNKKITIFAAHLKGTKLLYDVDLKKSCAILIGNEANGLSNEAAEKANFFVKIPMPGKAESVNAAIAGSIFIYEALRQRTF